MQNLGKFVEIDGFFIYGVEVNSKGRNRFEDWFYKHVHQNDDGYYALNAFEVIDDICSNAFYTNEMRYVMKRDFSYDCGEYAFQFNDDEFDVLYKAEEAAKFERVAQILNETHLTFEQELARLGW